MSPDVFGLVVAMSDGGLRLGYKLEPEKGAEYFKLCVN